MTGPRILTWAALSLLLAAPACAPTPERIRRRPEPAPVSPERPPDQPRPAPPRPPARQRQPAAVALADEASRLRREGETGRAAAALERALRIAPEDPLLWHDLASARLQEKRPEQAEQTARKSNQLATGDRELQARNWDLIAAARRMAGNEKSAREAQDRARELRQVPP